MVDPVRESAVVLTRRRDHPDPATAERWARRTLAQYPGCGIGAAALTPRRVLLLLERHGAPLRIRFR